MLVSRNMQRKEQASCWIDRRKLHLERDRNTKKQVSIGSIQRFDRGGGVSKSRREKRTRGTRVLICAKDKSRLLLSWQRLYTQVSAHLLLSLYALNTRLMSLFWKSWVLRMASASPNRRGSLRLLSTSSSCRRRLCVLRTAGGQAHRGGNKRGQLRRCWASFLDYFL